MVFGGYIANSKKECPADPASIPSVYYANHKKVREVIDPTDWTGNRADEQNFFGYKCKGCGQDRAYKRLKCFADEITNGNMTVDEHEWLLLKAMEEAVEDSFPLVGGNITCLKHISVTGVSVLFDDHFDTIKTRLRELRPHVDIHLRRISKGYKYAKAHKYMKGLMKEVNEIV
ncbi:uncharacterized protein LOC113346294 [Papaver somniferum]|uniref:uncharacterized protein LOC113346294 n=1 Tax=Papaver somniferum TaxID=3469 RepID=UPI000E6FB221|nr:uncharacterized protein LOC113346294 [Papaver somniferum]